MKKVFYHLGLCVVLVCALLGSLQTQSLRTQLREGIPERKAVDGKGIVHDLEETYLLHHYYQETYDSGKPKSYCSDLSVFTAAGQEIRGTVAVNHPMKVGLWRIYQYDPGVLLLVKNPFLPGVYLGIYLMLAAALLLLFDKGLGRNPWLLAAVLLAVGTGIYLFHGRLLSRELVPALQSMWYAPHVVVYMVAFTILTGSAVLALFLLVFPGGNRDKLWQVTDRLTCSGTAFFTVGMLLGSLWAQDAWGTYWGWDPKETWAAITWLVYLACIHLRRFRPEWQKGICLLLLLAYICLHICWWGINYLPFLRGVSLHTY